MHHPHIYLLISTENTLVIRNERYLDDGSVLYIGSCFHALRQYLLVSCIAHNGVASCKNSVFAKLLHRVGIAQALNSWHGFQCSRRACIGIDNHRTALRNDAARKRKLRRNGSSGADKSAVKAVFRKLFLCLIDAQAV